MKPEFSAKQQLAMTWWTPRSRYHEHEAIICDGAVRSGKTMALAMGFFLWAMSCFSNKRFALCGRTVGSIRRNLLPEILPRLEKLGMRVRLHQTQNLLRVTFGKNENSFFLFGGKDEASAALIQGITLAGVLMDEVVLMPRSFVEQACARCSVEGSKIWFSCNPEGPQHWFYKEWVQKAEEKNCLYVHFTMSDNPSLSAATRLRYKRLYSGTFYRRFVLGQWVCAEGRVYDFFDTAQVKPAPKGIYEDWVISCDYGTVNPASFGLWGRLDGIWYRVKEFYFDSKREGRQMTDAEYEQALRELAGGRTIREVIVDPSAASFLEVLRRAGWRVRKADNDVLSGIRRTADCLKNGKIVICDGCTDCLREMELYVWQDGSGKDRVVKKNDHAMDDMRYFVTGILQEPTTLAVCSVARKMS